MNESRIAAVVVTFNRKVLLCECLEALLRQSFAVDSIFVVDNASSDGTETLLRERGYLNNPRIQYLRLESNLGGAGGFHAGMSAAYEKGFEWIWLMDDDTEPYADALEQMRQCMGEPGVAAIANQKLNTRSSVTQDGLRLLSAPEAGGQHALVKYSSFVGLLVSRWAIAKVGLPRPEFFIHYDDTEYCIRLREAGNILLAADSCVVHKEVARGEARKEIFGYVFYQEDIYRFCFRYFKHRNFACILACHCRNPLIRYCRLVARFVCFAAAVLAFDRDYRWERIKILAKANWDGVRGRFDNSFPARRREEIGAYNSGAGR